MRTRMLILLAATTVFPAVAAPSLIVNCGLTVEAEAPVGELQAYDISLLPGTQLDSIKATIRVGKQRLELKTKEGELFTPKLEKYSDTAVSVAYTDADGNAPTVVFSDGGVLGTVVRVTYKNDSPVESTDRTGSVHIELSGGEITRLTFDQCSYKGGSADDWKAAFNQ